MVDIEKMKTLGKEWIADDKHRIYFNDLRGLYGLELNLYGTGNISSAKVDGVKISNGKARQLATDLDCAKFFYDVNAGTFGSVGLSDVKIAKITAEITRRLEGTA